MGGFWRAIGHYLQALASYLFAGPYIIYQAAKTAYHFATGQFRKATYNLIGLVGQVFFFPWYSIYQGLEGTSNLSTGSNIISYY